MGLELIDRNPALVQSRCQRRGVSKRVGTAKPNESWFQGFSLGAEVNTSVEIFDAMGFEWLEVGLLFARVFRPRRRD